MKKSLHKKLAACVMAATAAVTSALSVAAPMSASAVELIGESTFESGASLPWNVIEEAPARQTHEASDGTFNIHIYHNTGPDNIWDLQMRHRGFSILAGHTYKVHWELDSNSDGELYTCIGNYAHSQEVWHNNSTTRESFDQTWERVKIKKGHNEFETVFRAYQEISAAEWCFYFGGKSVGTGVVTYPTDCFPDGTILKFDNLFLTDLEGAGDIVEYNQTVPGDANCDDKVDIADAVLIMQFLANPEKYPISSQGYANADINCEDGVTGLDALEIQMIEAGTKK